MSMVLNKTSLSFFNFVEFEPLMTSLNVIILLINLNNSSKFNVLMNVICTYKLNQ